MFGRKRAAEKDEKVVDLASMQNLEDGPETRPCKAKKDVKGGDKFIKWSPSGIVQSPVPLSRQGTIRQNEKVS